MTTRAPRGRGSRRRPGRSQKKGSETAGWIASDEERDLRSSTRSRCVAVLGELEASVVDWSSVECILLGGAQDIQAAT
jgi:hypothetical protein